MQGTKIRTNRDLSKDQIRIERFEAISMPERLVDQIIAKSRQKHILKFEAEEDVGDESNPGRFWNNSAFSKWAGKDRIIYLMLRDVETQETPDVGGIIWFGKRKCPQSPEHNYTFAIRHYTTYDPDLYAEDKLAKDFTYPISNRKSWGQFLGKGYGTPFMQDTHKDVTNHDRQGSDVWLGVTEGNEKAINLYLKVGYKELATIPDPDVEGRHRIIMVYDKEA